VYLQCQSIEVFCITLLTSYAGLLLAAKSVRSLHFSSIKFMDRVISSMSSGRQRVAHGPIPDPHREPSPYSTPHSRSRRAHYAVSPEAEAVLLLLNHFFSRYISVWRDKRSSISLSKVFLQSQTMDRYYDNIVPGGHSVWLVVIYASLVYVLSISIYNAFWHPLAKVPGPFLAKFTKIWLFRAELSGDGANVLAALHKKYGMKKALRVSSSR
jgi:hypothetical protein